MLSQIETGRVAPNPEQLGRLATAFGCTVGYLAAELDLGPTTRPWLRAYADASRREATARLAYVTTAAEYIRRLDLRPFPDLIPRFSGDLNDEESIEESADEMRTLAQIGSDDVVSNAVRAAERLGCVVLPLDSELGRHLGMSARADDIPMLCVAKAGIPGDRQRFTVAHELGHLFLHSNEPAPQTAEESSHMEWQANRFASAFLAPADPLVQTLEDVGGKVTLRSLAEIKAIWGLAIKALVHRFASLGVIDTDYARSLYKRIFGTSMVQARTGRRADRIRAVV